MPRSTEGHNLKVELDCRLNAKRRQPGNLLYFISRSAACISSHCRRGTGQGGELSARCGRGFLRRRSTVDACNLLLMVEFKNMAALDKLRAKTDPILERIIGGEDQRRDAYVKRAELREILGNKTMREITLK